MSSRRSSAPGSSALAAPPGDRRPGWISSRPLAFTNLSYAALYAVDGALLPFLSVFLAYEHGLGPGQIGFVLAVSSAAAILTPPALTMVADRYGRAELLLLVSLGASAVALAVFAFVDGYWWILVVYAAFSLTREPTRPLLDGIFFTSQRLIPALARVSYHRVRIWGTFGYMVPGVLLYFTLSDDRDGFGSLPLLACGLAVFGVLAASLLPTRHHVDTAADGRGVEAGEAGDTGEGGAAARRPMPGAPGGGTTLRVMLRAAGRLLSRRRTALFIVAMFLLQASMSAYFAFYPLQATEVVGLSPRWLGLVTNLGVVLELGYMAAFGWLVRRLGWRWLVVAGALAAAVRVALLAAIPTVGVVVGQQVLHGLVIIVSMVAGRVILDRHAPDEIRHTAQGIYAMIVLGGGKIVGSAVGGLVAASSLTAVFWSSAGVAFVAAGILAWALRGEGAEPAPRRT